MEKKQAIEYINAMHDSLPNPAMKLFARDVKRFIESSTLIVKRKGIVQCHDDEKSYYLRIDNEMKEGLVKLLCFVGDTDMIDAELDDDEIEAMSLIKEQLMELD